MSYLADAPYAPRGERTRFLTMRLERDWQVELIRPTAASVPTERQSASSLRRIASAAARHVLLDKYEPIARSQFAQRSLDADAAYLIGFPFSPIAYAADSLRRCRTPYVVDIGDPWVLTARAPAVRSLARVRAQRAETAVWRGATGAVVTTLRQAAALRGMFPHLRVLVRPNGVSPSGLADIHSDRRRVRPTEDVQVFRLAHFGNLYEARIDVRPFLDGLAASGVWRQVEFHLFGRDWSGGLDGLRSARVMVRDPVSWDEVQRHVQEFDAVIAVGNHDPSQLPSKAIAYLALRAPRIALVSGAGNDALAAYVADKPAWIVVRENDADAAGRVAEHARRMWTDGDFQVPATEMWSTVVDEVAAFVWETLGVRAAVA